MRWVITRPRLRRCGPHRGRGARDTGWQLRPFLKATGIWTIDQQNTAVRFTRGNQLLAGKGLGSRSEIGVDMSQAAGFIFSGTVFYDGIGGKGFSTLSGSLHRDWKF